MRSMIELERAKAGLDYEGEILRRLSAALLESYDTGSSAASSAFIEPSLYEPYERLVGPAYMSEQPKIIRIQSYIKFVSDALSEVVGGNETRVSELIPICTTLHRELVQEINAEVAFAVNDWPAVHENAASRVCAA